MNPSRFWLVFSTDARFFIGVAIAASVGGAGASCTGARDPAATLNDAATDVTSSPDALAAEADAVDDGYDARSKLGSDCTQDAECDDGVFCDGVEECLGGFCSSARNVACQDSGGCATSTCVESAGGCEIDLPTAATSCQAGKVCAVALGCVATDGCTSDDDPKCDDQRSCTRDRCDVATGACLHVADDTLCPASVGACGVGVCLGIDVAGSSGCGARPDASLCARDQGCDSATLACTALPATCATDLDCSDASTCDGVEACVDGACFHGDRTTCVASDVCHHAECIPRSVGSSYCADVPIDGCTVGP